MPGVRVIALSQSLPTPITKELFLVVTREAVGASLLELAVPFAPMAPDPNVPVVSTPVKLITVIEEAVLRDKVAVTVTLVRRDGANARQISAVPSCVLVLCTSSQVSPAPAILITVVFVPEVGASVHTNANSNSLPDVVEKLAVATVVLLVPWSFETVWSIPIAAEAVPANSISKAKPNDSQVARGVIRLRMEEILRKSPWR